MKIPTEAEIRKRYLSERPSYSQEVTQEMVRTGVEILLEANQIEHPLEGALELVVAEMYQEMRALEKVDD